MSSLLDFSQVFMPKQPKDGSRREKLIRKEKEYAERRFTELLAKVDLIDDSFDEIIEKEILKLDEIWRAFCEHLIYISPNGKDEFIKVARARAFKTIKIEQ